MEKYKMKNILPLMVKEGKRLGMRGDDHTICCLAQKYATYHGLRSTITSKTMAETSGFNKLMSQFRACVHEFKGKTLASLEAEAQAGNIRSMVLLSDVHMFGLLGCERNAPLANRWSYEACNTRDPFGCANQAATILMTRLMAQPPSIFQRDQSRIRKQLLHLCEECARSSYVCPAVLMAGQRETFKATDFPFLTQVLVERLHDMRKDGKSSEESAASVSSVSSNPLQCCYNVCASLIVCSCNLCAQRSRCDLPPYVRTECVCAIACASGSTGEWG